MWWHLILTYPLLAWTLRTLDILSEGMDLSEDDTFKHIKNTACKRKLQTSNAECAHTLAA